MENEFEKWFKEYSKELETLSGGLVEPKKADLVKMIAFYRVVQKRTRDELKRNYSSIYN